MEARFGAVDVLDGSPPCSSFSTAGRRDRTWGVKKRFREGQAEQNLDMLFFDLVALAARLRPRIVVAENVVGIVSGKAKGYVLEIRDAMSEAGYDLQVFRLDASRMGVPQTRERVVFMARRRDLGIPALDLSFDEPRISAAKAVSGIGDGCTGRKLGSVVRRAWVLTRPGCLLVDGVLAYGGSRRKFYTWRKCAPGRPFFTITAMSCATHWDEPRILSRGELIRAQTYPDDYDFGKLDAGYACGMSVPPQMMRRIAMRVAEALGKPGC
jgi:DNA (cytosine-5)-methyltransferase 1